MPPPEVRLVNRVVPARTPPPPTAKAATTAAPESPPEGKLFAPEGSAEGCASGECLPAPPAPLELTPAEDDEPAQPMRGQTDHELWERSVDAVREASARHGKSLSVARFLGFTAEGVRVAFPPDSAFHRSQVIGMSRGLVEEALSKALGRPTKLIEDTTPGVFSQAQRSIAEVEASDRDTRERAIDKKVREHPAVRAVLRHLGGSIEHISILEPVARERPAAGPSEDAPPTEE